MFPTIESRYGIVLLSMVPVRSKATEQGEMVTQILFGDTFIINKKVGGWLYICNDYDGYHGWVSERSVQIIDREEYQHIKTNDAQVVSSCNAILQEEGKRAIHITMGSSLPCYSADKQCLSICGKVFKFHGEIVDKSEFLREDMLIYGQCYLNTPYLWGGKSIYGIDCSGFVQQVAKMVGIALPRDAYQQAKCGEEVDSIITSRPGDLAFFDNDEGRITHVGIIIDNEQIIHASGCVRIDRIDYKGIFNIELGQHTHNLCMIKSIVK